MALPITSLVDETPLRLDDDTLLEIINSDARALSESLPVLDEYRDYYEGEHAINFASEEFVTAVGDQFEDLVSNWMGVIVEAMEERLDIQRIRIRNEAGVVDEVATQEVWNVLLQNELEQLQNDTYNGALVESIAYILVWPDDEIGARVDFQPAQNMYVTYHPDDVRVIERAIKRWVTPDGGQRLNLYTRDFLYKYYIEPQGKNLDLDTIQPKDSGWQVYPVERSADPTWPLPNPFGEVPIVDFWNRAHKSEIRDVKSLQDALNKTIRDMLLSNEYTAQQILYIITSNEEPDGGWKASPGTVWHIQPELDFEGRPIPTEVGQINPAPPEGLIATVETFLQHIAAISRTPSYYFYLSSKQGGRGDAPSGEALRVSETGLLKKIQKVQSLWGLRWLRVARLILMATRNDDGETTLLGETVWTHPMAHFLSILLNEAKMMIEDLGLPVVVAWRHIGMSEEQIIEALESGLAKLVPGSDTSITSDTSNTTTDTTPETATTTSTQQASS